MIIRDGELATIMQHQEEDEAHKLTDKQQRATTSTPTGKYLIFVQRVLSLYLFIQHSITQNLGVASKVTTLEMDSMFFFADRLLHLQAVFRVTRKRPPWTQVISGLWDELSITLFLVSHFVMLIVKNLISYCLFLHTVASIYLQYLCFYFQISWH